jgi:AcrR family transcriptional regulator
MSTKDNILAAALELFNDEGTAAVSTNHIAEAAGISPGNLYYHFRNKEEIIRELFERLFAATDAGFNLPADKIPALDDLQQYVRVNYKILWAYRFAYRELAALLRSDPELRTNFLAYRKRGFEGFNQLFDAFVSAGVLTAPKNPEVRTNLAETIWLISEFWLNSLEIGGKPVDETQMERGVGLMMQVLEPYIKRP